MTPVPTQNHALLSVGNALVDEITTESGFKLYLAPEWNLEQNVSVSGKIASLPRNYTGNLSAGDEVAFSYQVISNRTFPNTAHWYVPVSDNEKGAIRIWMNHKGEKVRMIQHMGVINTFWVGTYFNSRGQFEQGTQGSESQVERWLHTNFKFGTAEGFIFKNKLHLNNQDYWKCNLENIFAKKVGDEIIAIGNRVICEIIDIDVPKKILEQSGLHIPESSVQMRFYDRGRVLSGGEKMGFKKGDIVSFEEKYCEKYELFGKQYFLIKENRINGFWE